MEGLSYWGSIASIAGVIIAIAGFIITFINVSTSRKVFIEAKKELLNSNTVSFLSTTIALIGQIKTLHREGKWNVLLYVYPNLRSALITIKTTNPDLPSEYKSILTKAVRVFSGIEKKVEQAIEDNTIPQDITSMNSTVSNLMDALQVILDEIKFKKSG